VLGVMRTSPGEPAALSVLNSLPLSRVSTHAEGRPYICTID